MSRSTRVARSDASCLTRPGDAGGRIDTQRLDSVALLSLHPTSMLRYYMTPETRQAVIDESNRLIARRAALNASRRNRDDLTAEASSMESAFARLVADLQSAAAGARPVSESLSAERQ
jgi:hypothetical protein